jgi:hypothetical protein
MVAGALSKSGYFMGDDLVPARASNPKGFFEDREVNGINEALIAQVVPKRPRVLGKWLFRSRPLKAQRWLAQVPLDTNIPCSEDIARRIRNLTEGKPYCFKDPRFSYTLPAWRPLLKDTVYICVFRDPASTALSILKECKEAAYLHSLRITFEQALKTWTLMYRHILERHRREGAWLFLHYDQMLTEEGLARLEKFVGVPVDVCFPEPSLRRSISDQPFPKDAGHVYESLCALAGFEGLNAKNLKPSNNRIIDGLA